MKYERQYTETVEAERIPDDPRISDLERLRAWSTFDYIIDHDEDGAPVIVWAVVGRLVDTNPGDWIVKDEEECISFLRDDDFRANFRSIPVNVDAPFDEWVLTRPPVLNYG